MVPIANLFLALLCLLLASFGFVCWFGWRDTEARFKRISTEHKVAVGVIERLTAERDELLRQKKSLTHGPLQEQDRTQKRYSGAQLRRMAEAENARYEKSLETVPNSEVLGKKEDEWQKK